MKKQYLLFMAIMNFVACPLDEGIRPFNHGLLFSSLITESPNVGLNTASLIPIPPNRGPLKIGPAGVVIRIPPAPHNPYNDDVIFKPNVIIVGCLESGNIFIKEPNNDITRDTLQLYFMGDPEKNPEYTKVQNTTIEHLVHLFEQSPYTEIEPWGLIIKVEENGSVAIYQKSVKENVMREGVLESYASIMNALCMSMLAGKDLGLIVSNAILQEKQIPNMIPRSSKKPYRHPTNRGEDMETYFTTSDAIIAYMKLDNPFIRFVEKCMYSLIIIQDEINSPEFAQMCPDAQMYQDFLRNITMQERPRSYSEVALRLNPLYPLLDQQNLTNIIPRTIALLKECYSLNQSNIHYRGFPVSPMMSIIKPNRKNWTDFLKPFKQIEYLKELCRYFEMEYSENVVILFNHKGFDKLSPTFGGARDFYGIGKDIPTNFQQIVGLQTDGDIQFMVKFGPESFMKGKKQTWSDFIRNPDQFSPDTIKRMSITGEVLVLSGGNRAEITRKPWDEGFGEQYTLETLPATCKEIRVRANNGELEIRADVPQAAPGPVVAPAPVVQQNAVAAPAVVSARTMPELEEIHQLNIPLGPLGPLKWTGDNTVKQKFGGPVHELSNFMNGTSIPNGFKAVSIQLSIENMREVLDILKKCKQDGHFLYAVLPNNAIKGDRFFVGRDIQGLYAGCIRKGKLYSEE